ncbi:MAG: hypothetical protein ACM34H_01730 [Deltaproteobacteria bacterium]
MMPINWEHEIDRVGHRVLLSGLPIAMHCHHYNINLQKMLEDTMGETGPRLLFQAAEEASFHGFNSFLRHYSRIRTVKSKLEVASTIYQNCGLGVMHFQRMGNRGGIVVSPSSHHVIGWLAKHGKRQTPGCHFARGWVAGVLEAIYDHPLQHFAVEEIACKMMREKECKFVVKER